MTNQYDRLAEKLTVFDTSLQVTPRTRALYVKLSSMLMQQYEKADSNQSNQFDNLHGICWVADASKIPCAGALGCATFGDNAKVYSLFYNDFRFDSFIISMELAHHALLEYYGELGDIDAKRKCNDIIHYAANLGKEPLVYWRTAKIKEPFSIISRLLGIKTVPVPAFYYNIQALIKDGDNIMNLVRNHLAPNGVNPYWSAMPNTAAKADILRWLSQHEHDHE